MTFSERALLSQVKTCLSGFIESPLLDVTLLANDCLQSFSDYEWQAKDGLSESEMALWDSLLSKGNSGELDAIELSAFFDLLAHDEIYHAYYHRIQARKLLDDIEHRENEEKLPVLERIEKLSKADAAISIFDLESEELNKEVAALLSPDAIYDAVSLSSSLTINIEGEEYTLEPYLDTLSEDDVLGELQSFQSILEHRLTEQHQELSEK
jgi:hypothetical protein